MSIIEIPELVPDIREQIYKYLDISDIMNIACCSRAYYDTVKYILWYVFRMNWKRMVNKELVVEKTKYLDMTIHLMFDSYRGTIGEDGDTGDMAASYEYMIRKCSPNALISLHFSSYMVPNALTCAAEHLPDIKEMSFSTIKNTFDELDWDQLCNFKLLRRLNIHACYLPNGCFKHISNLLELTEITILGCREVTNNILEEISEAPNLKKLNFSNHKHPCHVTPDGYRNIAKLVDLVEVDFSFSEITHPAFVELSETLKKVTLLKLTACFRLSGEALVHISKLVSMKNLDISYCQEISDGSLKHLSALSNLSRLNLTGIRRITDGGIFNVSQILSLTEVNLTECGKFTDTGVFHLSKLPLLDWLSIYKCKNLTDDGMTYISKMKRLKTLNIAYCVQITDNGLFCLTELHTLKWLQMMGLNSITDKGLLYVSKLVSLTELDISYCDDLTDNGIVKLPNLTSLLCLNIFGCKKITDQGLRDLQNLLAKRTTLNVDHERFHLEENDSFPSE